MADVRLHVQEVDGYLPPVCMVCGKKATTTTVKKMQWCPPWAGGLIGLIMMKYATVQAPFCEDHKGHWFNRNLATWGTFFLFGLVAIGLLVLGANLGDMADKVMPVIGIFCFILLIAWIVILCYCQFTMIRPKEITDEEIHLTGVCEGFVEALADADHERKRRRAERRRRRRDDDDDEDDDRRRRRRSRDDRYER